MFQSILKPNSQVVRYPSQINRHGTTADIRRGLLRDLPGDRTSGEIRKQYRK